MPDSNFNFEKPRKSGRLRHLRYSMLPALMNGFESNERFRKSSKSKIRDEKPLVKFFVQKLNIRLPLTKRSMSPPLAESSVLDPNRRTLALESNLTIVSWIVF